MFTVASDLIRKSMSEQYRLERGSTWRLVMARCSLRGRPILASQAATSKSRYSLPRCRGVLRWRGAWVPRCRARRKRPASWAKWMLEVDLLDLTCARMMRGRGEAHEVVLARHPRVMDVSHQHAQSSNASFFFARLGVSAVTRTSVRFGHEVREPLPVIFSSQGCDAGGQYCSGGTSWAAG